MTTTPNGSRGVKRPFDTFDFDFTSFDPASAAPSPNTASAFIPSFVNFVDNSSSQWLYPTPGAYSSNGIQDISEIEDDRDGHRDKNFAFDPQIINPNFTSLQPFQSLETVENNIDYPFGSIDGSPYLQHFDSTFQPAGETTYGFLTSNNLEELTPYSSSFDFENGSAHNTLTDLGDESRAQVYDTPISDTLLSESCLPQLVCFGAICDVSVRPLPFLDKNISLVASYSQTDQEFLHFDVVKRDGHYAISSNGHDDIGVLNLRMMKALESLNDLGGVAYQALLESSAFCKYTKSKNCKEKPLDLSAELNIYGPQSKKDQVGKLLAISRLHLQAPLNTSTDTMVDNPHLIKFPNLASDLASESLAAQLPTPSPTPQNLNDADPDGLIKLLENLDQSDNSGFRDHSQRIEIDWGIATKLLDHQRKSVIFQLQREVIEPTSSLSLWRNLESSTSDITFQHKITKKRTSAPQTDARGGILADEMGLGKTLTMLATILTTLNQSRNFRDSYTGSSQNRVSNATLVITPSPLLLDGWISEIEQHIGPGILRTHKYHGDHKLKGWTDLADFDIVLTTYHTLATEFSRPNSDLHGITWYRIVLDEAHNIRNQRTTFFKAAAALSANIRWCLTGTPIQNKIEDIGALVRFLRIPFLSDISEFRKYIVQPIESGESWGFENFRTLLKSICIRRTKDLLQLPEPEMIEYQLSLSSAERSHYLQVGEAYRKAIDDAVCGKKLANAYRSVFQVLLVLRMICNHGTISVANEISLDIELDDPLALLQDDPATCAYCFEDAATDGATEGFAASQIQACSHVVCGVCVPQYQEDLQRLNDGFDMACPLCKEPLRQDPSSHPRSLPALSTVQNSPTSDQVSTKLSKLLEDVTKHRFSDKCIIFSTWKKTLSVTAAMLREHDIPFVQIDGSLSLAARHQVLSAFQHDVQTSVLLMTLGTGAVGLNLTVATRIHIIEPQWNPSIESQAIGRAVRLGQGKQVTIVRYVVQKTVEQYIQSRQFRKLQLAEIGFESTSENSDEVKLMKLKEFRKYLDA